MRQPKVLIFDIETAPMVVYVWGRREQNVALNQIKSDWYVLAWAAKWLGDAPSKVIYKDQRGAKNPADDKDLLQGMWKLLDEADIVITQNGRRFDSRKLNARFIINGMNPPSPYEHWDTLRVARTVADFTSNSLEYLSDKLCVKYKKLSHKKFPAMELWKQCLAQNPEAWECMKKYNIHDVLATEELYLKIRAWSPKTSPVVFPNRDGCSVCGGQVEYRGYWRLKEYRVKKIHCLKCGAWRSGKKERLQEAN